MLRISAAAEPRARRPSVRQQIIEVNGRFLGFGEPKTAAGKRTVEPPRAHTRSGGPCYRRRAKGRSTDASTNHKKVMARSPASPATACSFELSPMSPSATATFMRTPWRRRAIRGASWRGHRALARGPNRSRARDGWNRGGSERQGRRERGLGSGRCRSGSARKGSGFASIPPG